MQTLQLREHESTRITFPLDDRQLDALRKARVSVQPIDFGAGVWELCPSSHIGVVGCGDLRVVVRPKIPIDRVMFLLSYSLSPGDWRSAPFRLTPSEDILDAIIPAFVLRTQEAIRRGLLQGYRTEEESLATVRGRIRMADQINSRHGIPLPVEAVYDDFTEDIEENRLLKTAVHTLWQMPVRSEAVRRELGALRPAFSSVAMGSYHRAVVPEVSYTRLNLRYRPAVELARLILGDSVLELYHGETTGASFLMDMNRVFEDFLRTALREALHLTEVEWPGTLTAARSMTLDEAGAINLYPDLSWWRGRHCLFVGDAKYKQLEGQQADVYQMLAYCVAADVPSGLLVYAAGEAEAAVHRIPKAGKAIEVAAIDLSGQPSDILAEVERIADRVRALSVDLNGVLASGG